MGDIGEFVSEAPKEIKKFIWRIKDFRVTAASGVGSSNSDLSIYFDIGSSIGLSSRWKMQILPDSCTGRDLEHRTTHLKVSRAAGETEVTHFSCMASLKNKDDPEQVLTTIELHPDCPIEELEHIPEALIEDELVIHVEFVLCSPAVVVTTTGNDTLCGGAAALENYGDLLNTGDNFDFMIRVKKLDGERNWEIIPVHKAILGARSSVFKTMLEAQMKERENGTLVIEDLSPACVKIVLKYIYTGNLDNDWKDVPDEMVMAADKYNLPLLLKFLNRRLHCVCTFANALKLREVASLHELDIAGKNINKFIASNIDNIFGIIFK